MRKIKYQLFAIISIALLILAGCNGKGDASSTGENDGNDDGKPNIAVVLKGSDQEYFKLAEQGAKQAFEDFDVNGTFLAASTQTNTTEIINILEDLLIEEPDALVAMPSTEEQTPVLKRYHEKGIPVLLIDTDLDWGDKTTYIGTNNYTAGQEAGKFLASTLSDGDEIAILEGVSGAAVSEQRVKGVEDVMEEEGIKIVASLAADFDRVKAVTTMENILTANPNIKGIFTANDEMAMGAYEVVKSRNLDIPIIGIDGTSDALESISNAGLTATVAQSPYQMGYQGVENALKVVNGETIEKEIDIKIEVLTEENAGDSLVEINAILSK
ncbi:sugar ABC transporter substrate-binding protein [Oceanobacillus polygoni]|uniref:Ribose transport system substrate-binding protein n=1 Tax=Oceanobacillus polygoni TaxID=1235259 RepID=A0A9X0YS65_9BACI|nr:sugar ABC transporter substrate-binding protein [Oceanobacillus polygoni]MBP2076006.1 ribose transport system substrate-binding protein [Oceanobacillus polygoni]